MVYITLIVKQGRPGIPREKPVVSEPGQISLVWASPYPAHELVVDADFKAVALLRVLGQVAKRDGSCK